MAATGLLGINPYFKGVSIDTSKPVNLAIQLEQKNQAKREALDKYFMDYEKSINPAGMRDVDQDIVLKKLNQNKQFYMQNRDRILNPSKYGAEAQSQYMAGFKDILSDISKSKQAYAENKVAQNHFIAQKDLNAPDGYVEAIEASRLPISDPRYRPLDVTQFKFWKSFDPFDFGKELKSLNTIPGKPELIKEGNLQYQRTPMEADINNVKSFSYNKLGDVGYVKMLQNLSNEEIGQLKNVYRQRMNVELPVNNARELSLAYTLTNLPKDYVQGRLEEQPAYKRAQEEAKARRNIDYSNQNQTPTTHLFDIFGSGTGISSPKIDIKDGTATVKKDGSLYSGNIVVKKEQLPSDFSAALSSAGISKNDIEGTDFLTINYKNGKAESISSELLGKIDANQMARYQDALNKKIYGIKGAITRTTAVPRTSDKASTGKVIKTAQFLQMSLPERQKFLNSGGTHSK
jgi:hypothetical protein